MQYCRRRGGPFRIVLRGASHPSIHPYPSKLLLASSLDGILLPACYPCRDGKAERSLHEYGRWGKALHWFRRMHIRCACALWCERCGVHAVVAGILHGLLSHGAASGLLPELMLL